MSVTKVRRGTGLGYTPHGFRSSFRDWMSETTKCLDRVVEAALAHAVNGRTEAAYRRGALLDSAGDSWEDGAAIEPAARGSVTQMLRGAIDLKRRLGFETTQIAG